MRQGICGGSEVYVSACPGAEVHAYTYCKHTLHSRSSHVVLCT
jgi:hypothetical protein